jgi:hypothetical protein
MSTPEQNGSLLRDPNPEFEKYWDNMHTRVKDESAKIEAKAKDINDDSVELAAGSALLSQSAEIVPVQEVLF